MCKLHISLMFSESGLQVQLGQPNLVKYSLEVPVCVYEWKLNPDKVTDVTNH